jgi:predicted small secreted protein
MRILRLAVLAVLAGLSLGVAACSNTWAGLKEDTRENTAAVGRGMEHTGEKVQQQAQ